MDRKLFAACRETTTSEWKQGETKRWIQQVMCIHLYGIRQTGTGSRICGKDQPGRLVCGIKSLQLEKMKLRDERDHEVVYCHDQ